MTPITALTILLLSAGRGSAGSANGPGGSRPKPRPPVREQVLSCEGGRVYYQDGHYYRLVRGAWVECDPDLPPAV